MDDCDMEALRRHVSRLEGRETCSDGASRVLVRFGDPRIDAHLGGGLRIGALHEVAGAETDSGAPSGFAAALLARISSVRRGKILWVRAGSGSLGAVHPHGMAQFGVDPGRLVVCRFSRARDALRTLDESLRCADLAAVVGELVGRDCDFAAGRRLHLRAETSGVFGLLLSRGSACPGAGDSRWRVEPLPSASGTLIGPPAWRVSLERLRAGAPAEWTVRWDPVRGALRHAARPEPHLDRHAERHVGAGR